MTLHHPELTKQQMKYREVRRRIWNAPAWKDKADPSVPDNVVLFKPRIKQPLWKEEETHFDAHVKQYQRRLAEMAFNPPRAYLKERCNELGISFAAVIGQGRRHEIVIFRQLFMWEIQQKFGMSYPAIGRLFGGRDHTTVLYSVRKIEKMKAEGKL